MRGSVRKETLRFLSVTIGLATILGFLPLLLGKYVMSLLMVIYIWIVMAGSWAIFSGLSGYISLGHVAFSGIGSYTVALTAAFIPHYFALALSGIVALIFALAIGYPVLRVRGPYFVILTFGISEATSILINYYQTTVQKIETIILPLKDPLLMYYYFLTLAFVSILTMYLIKRMRFGIALLSIREDEDIAETVGINTTKYKILGFGISAMFAGFLGGGLAFYRGFFETAGAFNPLWSFQAAIMAMLGGATDVLGPVVGAIILVLLSEVFGITHPHHYLLIVGVLLIIVVKFSPSGFVHLIRKGIILFQKKWERSFKNI